MQKLISMMPCSVKDFLRPSYYRIASYFGFHRRSLRAMHQFWRSASGPNRPENYLYPVKRSQFLVDLVKDYATEDMKFLEVGSSVGRNLWFLWQANYRNLEGVEINCEALKIMDRAYPSMARHVKIYSAPVEEIVRRFSDNQFDVVFTMGMLSIIHPRSEWVFSEMARITKQILILVEDENCDDVSHFGRDYNRIFTELGMKQIKTIDCSTVKALSDDALSTAHYTVRVFLKTYP